MIESTIERLRRLVASGRVELGDYAEAERLLKVARAYGRGTYVLHGRPGGPHIVERVSGRVVGEEVFGCP